MMKNLLLLAFFTLVFTVFFGNSAVPCGPCNNCICVAKGIAISCTTRLCPPAPLGSAGGAGVDGAPTKEPPFKCEPGTSWPVDCNTCFCNDEGTGASCTEIACGDPDPGKRCD